MHLSRGTNFQRLHFLNFWRGPFPYPLNGAFPLLLWSSRSAKYPKASRMVPPLPSVALNAGTAVPARITFRSSSNAQLRKTPERSSNSSRGFWQTTENIGISRTDDIILLITIEADPGPLRISARFAICLSKSFKTSSLVTERLFKLLDFLMVFRIDATYARNEDDK